MPDKWKSDAEQKIDEALDEVERGEVVHWQFGDCAKMGREYLSEKRKQTEARSRAFPRSGNRPGL
jgi:hypothetical protein